MAQLDLDGALQPDLEAGIELPLTAVAVGAWVRKASRRTLRLLLFNDVLVLLVGWQLRPRAVRSRTATARALAGSYIKNYMYRETSTHQLLRLAKQGC
jgi:hypothetical protein